MKSGHFFTIGISQSTPLLIIIMITAYFVFVWMFIPNNTPFKKGFNSSKMINVYEGLPNFFDSLKLEHAKQLIEENKCLQVKYGFEIHECTLIEKLEMRAWPRHAIQGTPWYSILCNPHYTE